MFTPRNSVARRASVTGVMGLYKSLVISEDPSSGMYTLVFLSKTLLKLISPMHNVNIIIPTKWLGYSLSLYSLYATAAAHIGTIEYIDMIIP
jgi:hypothetical protein